MKTIFNHKLACIAMSLTTVFTVTGTAHAASGNPTDITTTVNVASGNVCVLTVTPGNTSLSAKWSHLAPLKDTDSGTMAITSKGDATIDATVTGSGCSLNGMTLDTTIPASTARRGAFAVAMPLTSGSEFRFNPTLNNIRLYHAVGQTSEATRPITAVSASGYNLSYDTVTNAEGSAVSTTYQGTIFGYGSSASAGGSWIGSNYSNAKDGDSSLLTRTSGTSGSVTNIAPPAADSAPVVEAVFSIGGQLYNQPLTSAGAPDYGNPQNGDAASFVATVVVNAP